MADVLTSPDPQPGQHTDLSGDDLKVFRWRHDQLRRAGADEHTAELLAERFDLDLHLLCASIAVSGVGVTLRCFL